jgi:hypothetical protein
LKSEFRSYGGSNWSHGGSLPLTMGRGGSQWSREVCRSVVADSHNLDEDPNPHYSYKWDLDLHRRERRDPHQRFGYIPTYGTRYSTIHRREGKASPCSPARMPWYQCCGIGTVGTLTFCLSGTGTVSSYGSETVIQLNHKS